MNRLADIFVDDTDDKSVLILQEAIDKAIEIISKNREYEKLIKFAEWLTLSAVERRRFLVQRVHLT